MAKNFNEFIQKMYSQDLDEEEMEIIDNLSLISEPDNFTREEYADKVEETFGCNIIDAHDKKDISYMTRKARENMPAEVSASIDEAGILDDIHKEALERSKEYHPATLALSVSDALYNATDHRVSPSVILPDTAPASAFELADAATESGESYESDGDEDYDDEDEGYDDFDD